jgi:hypothetical protein
MFGRQPKENNPPEIPEVKDIFPSPSTGLADEKKLMVAPPQSEVVNVVEKISAILSPYFVVIVGLFLYEDNVLIGTLLIALGILSLLKISRDDLGDFLNKIKTFFLGSSKE